MIHAHEPDAVYIVGHAEHILASLELLEEIGYDGVKCTTSAVYLAELLDRGNPALEGVVLSLDRAQRRVEQDSDTRAAIARLSIATRRNSATPTGFLCRPRLRRHAGRAPGPGRGDDPSMSAEFRRYLRIGLQEFDGVTGTIAFDERGDVRRYPTMHTIWNGRVVQLRAGSAIMKKRKLKQLIEGITPTRVQPPAPILRLEV